MAEKSEVTIMKGPTIADPAALGLAGFALTTFLLSIHNISAMTSGTAWSGDGLTWIGLAFFYGGLAQFCAGMWEFRNQNTFGAAAFSSYGGFWMGLAFFFVFYDGTEAAKHVETDLGWFLLAFAIFNTYMLIWSLRTNTAIFLVFITLEITEILLFIGFFAGADVIVGIGGIVGVICAACAWYAAAAAVGNSLSSKTLAPVGPPLWKDPPEELAPTETMS